MKISIYHLILVFTLIQTVALAQINKLITPMHKFMQANADSTIVLEFTTNWIHYPQYFLLSKKGDTLTCYVYKSNTKLNSSLSPAPKKIRQQIIKNNSKIFSEPVDINLYFNIYKMTSVQVKAFWDEVAALKPWTLKDDSTEGKGCPAAPHKNTEIEDPVIYDGGGIRLSLITNTGIRFLEFYAPDYYEKNCPGRPGRIAINHISKLFQSNFKIE